MPAMGDDPVEHANDVLNPAYRESFDAVHTLLARAVLSQHTRIRELEGQVGLYQDILSKAAKDNKGDPTALAHKVCDERRDLPYPVAYALARQVFRDNEHKAALMLRIRELEDKCIEMQRYTDERRVVVEEFRAALGEALGGWSFWADTNRDRVALTRIFSLRKLLEKP